jgi:hypothetical protein
LDPLGEIRLEVGESEVIPIGGAGAVGYTWQSDVDGDLDAITFSILPATSPPTAPAPNTSSPMPPSAGSSDQLLTIKAEHPGTVLLRLRLARPFQPQREPLKTMSLRITVTATG